MPFMKNGSERPNTRTFDAKTTHVVYLSHVNELLSCIIKAC